MKKNTLFFALLIIPFWNYAQNFKDKTHYIEFVDKCNCPTSKLVIENIKKELYKTGYLLQKNEWQGITEVKKGETIELSQGEEYHPNIHKFKDFSTYTGSEEDIKNDVLKIVITFDIKNNTPTFSYRSFRKRGHKEWQNYSNAGNFRHTSKPTTEYWMIRHITLLTFK